MVYLHNFFRCIDVYVCGNEEELYRNLDRLKNNPDQHKYIALKSEIKEILDDSDFDYMHLLENDEYEIGLYGVKMPESQLEAKKFIVKYIWNKLYPEDKMGI